MHNASLVFCFWICCRYCFFIPANPSAQMTIISSTPRFFNSFRTPSQYLLLSFSPICRDITSFFPSAFIPSITYAASFLITWSSHTEKWTASMKTIGYTLSRGLFCQSSISCNILSVILEMKLSLHSKP